MSKAIVNELPAQDPLPDVTLPQVQPDLLHAIQQQLLVTQKNSKPYSPRVLLLSGSLRERSYSRLLAEECARLLLRFGADTRIFNPQGLPLVDSEDTAHQKVQELYSYVNWSEAMVWVSPERHGAMTGLLKSQCLAVFVEGQYVVILCFFSAHAGEHHWHARSG